MLTVLIFTLYFCSLGASLPREHELIYFDQLQELCPSMASCEEETTQQLPEMKNKTIEQCCKYCSCKLGCEANDNCCNTFSGSDGKENGRIECVSSVITTNIYTKANYLMVHSCSNIDTVGCNYTLFDYNSSDVTSFSPVVSLKTQLIYVNSECALCNGDIDTVPWTLAMNCPYGMVEFSYVEAKHLQGRGDNGYGTGCDLVYIPPDGFDLRLHVCTKNDNRTCRISGNSEYWKPLLDYCPLYDSRYSSVDEIEYGTFDCYICNTTYTFPLKSLCHTNNKFPTDSFTSILDGKQLAKLSTDIKEKEGQPGYRCPTGTTQVRSIVTKSMCREILCPWGQFRVGRKCDFIAKSWRGGPFKVVIRAVPIDYTQKINISITSDPQIKKDKRATWLQRDAMKNWYIETLFKPSDTWEYIEYFVIYATYPFNDVNPRRLMNILERTMKETWYVKGEHGETSLKTEFSPFHTYYKVNVENYTEFEINDTYVFFSSYHMMLDHDLTRVDKALLGFTTVKDRYGFTTEVLLGSLFLCEQIELYEIEYERIGISNGIYFKVTNTTFYSGEYMLSQTSIIRICLNQFPPLLNHYVSMFNHDLWVFYLILLTCVNMLRHCI